MKHEQKPKWITGATVCGIAGVAVFLNSLFGDFIFDDVHAIVRNRDVLGEASMADLWLNDYWGMQLISNDSHKSYRPLTVLTFRLNHALHGLSPVGFHAFNVALHGVVCFLSVPFYIS